MLPVKKKKKKKRFNSVESMMSFKTKLINLFRRVKCIVACCESNIIIENSQVDDRSNDEESQLEQKCGQ